MRRPCSPQQPRGVTFADAGRGRRQAPLWLPVLLLAAGSLVARAWDLDRGWERGFWSPTAGWRGADNAWVQFLYHYGTWPTLFVGAGSALAWIGCQVTGRWQYLRQPTLFLALLLALGPGLLVNVVFKEHFRRPRPTQAIEFGGTQPFRPVGELGRAGEGKSFPSGHASMGFYWLGLFIFFWHRKRSLAWLFSGVGVVHGLIMGIGRMVQGGHWFTDVLWSAGFVYLAAWLIHYLLEGQGPGPPAMTRKNPSWPMARTSMRPSPSMSATMGGPEAGSDQTSRPSRPLTA